MATIIKTQAHGRTRYKSLVRKKGHRTVARTFDLRKDAEQWGRKEERRIASRKPYSPDEDSFLDEMDDFDDFDDDYSDYNEDEFDTYSGLSLDH